MQKRIKHGIQRHSWNRNSGKDDLYCRRPDWGRAIQQRKKDPRTLMCREQKRIGEIT